MHVKDAADYTHASLHTWIYAVFIRRPIDTAGLVNIVVEAVSACNDLV